MQKQLDILTLEVGSTITKANGFLVKNDEYFVHVAQGFSPTTVLDGDVSIGVEKAIEELEKNSQYKTNTAKVFINSSAAGGLKMSVHGLTMNMTARAAKEASLGAGGIIKKLTAGEIFDHDLDEIKDIKPNLILLAGGVDYGDTKTVLANADKLMQLDSIVPIIYAGNIALQKPIKNMAQKYHKELWLAENVFPAVDTLNISPLRQLIHEAFSRHIIHAPGMEKLSRYTSAEVLPTPGAVLLATQIFAEFAGDCVVVDVGGATTDIHSVTDGSSKFWNKMIDPEPREKRTVEGDLGVFVNAKHVLALDKNGTWKSKENDLKAMPEQEQEKSLTSWLCEMAVTTGIQRHAGTITEIFTPSGRKQIVRGKDLTAVKWLIGTGGALTKIEGGEKILQRVCVEADTSLLPPPDAKVFLDKNYLFSALGTLSKSYPNMVKETLKNLLKY